MIKLARVIAEKLSNVSRLTILFITLSFITSCSSITPTKQVVHDWNNTVKQVSSGVVSIHTDVPVSFDGSWNKNVQSLLALL